MKTCTKCNVEFPNTLEYFYKNGKILRSQCKVCKNKIHSKWQKANPEKVNAIAKAWRDKNPEKRKIIVAAWKKANPDKVRTDNRKQNRKRKALKAGVVHEDWSEKELFEKFGTDCYICNNPIDFDAPKKGPGSDYSSWPDHMTPTSRGGENTIKNVRPCHRYCNESKGNKTYEEYMLTVNSQDIVTQPL